MIQLAQMLDVELKDEHRIIYNYIMERMGDTYKNDEGKNILDRLLDIQQELTKREGA